MDKDAFFKLPRLYVDSPLGEGMAIALDAEHVHYLHTVLRRGNDAQIRLFNGRDGEWLCTLRDLGRKAGTALAQAQIKPQPAASPGIHLYFAPIKKSRMDWLVEKAVELGATHLHPVITQNTEVREVNDARLRQQMREAAEQCERLDLPVLCETAKLYHLPADLQMVACLERGDTVPLATALPAPDAPVAVLIGPEGGFTAEEAIWIAGQKHWIRAGLGPRILRCETAACVALTAVLLR